MHLRQFFPILFSLCAHSVVIYNVFMSKRTLTSLILTCFLSLSALAAAEDVYKSLGLSKGTVTSLSESDEDHCANGPFQIIGNKDEEVLMVGTNITFDLPTKEKINAVASDENTCAEDVQSTLAGKKLKLITTIHTCPLKLKKLESVTEESIEVTGQTIKYLKKTGKEKTECIYKWVANEKT